VVPPTTSDKKVDVTDQPLQKVTPPANLDTNSDAGEVKSEIKDTSKPSDEEIKEKIATQIYYTTGLGTIVNPAIYPTVLPGTSIVSTGLGTTVVPGTSIVSTGFGAVIPGT